MSTFKKAMTVVLLLVLFMVSFVYLCVDFGTSDVNPNTRLFAVTQLVFTALLTTCFILHYKKRQKQLYAFSGRVLCLVLAVMQIFPAMLWIMFSGSRVSEYPTVGVMAHWLYGAGHSLLAILCIILALAYYRKDGRVVDGQNRL